MEKRVRDLTLDEFTQVLGSKAPVPGGGGASAVAASVGVALGQMVASLTTGKRRYADAQPRIDALLPRLDALRAELLGLADADAAAFEPLSQVYRMPKSTEGERAQRDQAMESALVGACEVPLQIMQAICEAIGLVDEVARIGSRMALSDAGAAAALLESALKAASLNVLINARSMADEQKSRAYLAQTEALVQKGSAVARETYEYVRSSL